MSAKVMFLTKSNKQNSANQKPILTIPKTAVVNRNGKQVVFMVKNDKAIEIPVIIGKQLGDNVEIKSGLVNGDMVVETVTDKIKNVTKVNVKE